MQQNIAGVMSDLPRVLLENYLMLAAAVENQNLSRLKDVLQYEQRVHNNLMNVVRHIEVAPAVAMTTSSRVQESDDAAMPQAANAQAALQLDDMPVARTAGQQQPNQRAAAANAPQQKAAAPVGAGAQLQQDSKLTAALQQSTPQQWSTAQTGQQQRHAMPFMAQQPTIHSKQQQPPLQQALQDQQQHHQQVQLPQQQMQLLRLQEHHSCLQQQQVAELSKLSQEQHAPGSAAPQQGLTWLASVNQSVTGLLAHLGLLEFAAVLEREHIDMAALQLMEERHLRELGLPIGAVIKIKAALQMQV